ncbi:uncharacterized protein LOC143296879 isoform X1 [Babylonia areolata]|uniref:uncharacterized protein LOC143296879 isoform X1 n=1 Tax=Babylonia areolata TaxID=304850 RepID=UPI003FD4574C
MEIRVCGSPRVPGQCCQNRHSKDVQRNGPKETDPLQETAVILFFRHTHTHHTEQLKGWHYHHLHCMPGRHGLLVWTPHRKHTEQMKGWHHHHLHCIPSRHALLVWTPHRRNQRHDGNFTYGSLLSAFHV